MARGESARSRPAHCSSAGAPPLEEQAAAAAQAVGVSLQPFAAPVEDDSRSAPERLAAAFERRDELGEVRNDEAGSSRRRGCADVGGEIAERRVLLVADRGHDGHRAGDDGAHEPLVAERQQILEAAAAAGEHDHVDAGSAATD